ncbi:MAG: hypothetical protein R2731_00555 [Nocardioides sp.]
MESQRRRYLILLPAPEEEWAQLPESEHEAGMANHQRFHETLASGDHRILAAGPLEQSAAAISMRNTRRGRRPSPRVRSPSRRSRSSASSSSSPVTSRRSSRRCASSPRAATTSSSAG